MCYYKKLFRARPSVNRAVNLRKQKKFGEVFKFSLFFFFIVAPFILIYVEFTHQQMQFN